MITRMKKLNPTDAEIIFAANLKHLTDTYMDKAYLASKSGVSSRMITFLINLERGASIDTVSRLANAMGVPAWVLLVENLTSSMVKNRELGELIENYVLANEPGRGHIVDVSRKEAIKRPLSPTGGKLKHIKEGDEDESRRSKSVRNHQLPRKKKAK